MANFTIFPVNSSTIQNTTPGNLLSEINISKLIRDVGVTDCVLTKVIENKVIDGIEYKVISGTAILHGYNIDFTSDDISINDSAPYYLGITVGDNIVTGISISNNSAVGTDRISIGTINSSTDVVSKPINAANVTYNTTTVENQLNSIGDPNNIAKTNLPNTFTGKQTINGNSTSDALEVTGYIRATRVYNAVYNDYAELVKKETNVITTQGDIIAKVPGKDTYMLANQNNKKLIVGVHSETYGSLLGGDEDKTLQQNLKTHIPIAVCGFVPVKVIGKIKEGDFITISNIPGVGTKSKWVRKNIVGKALETNYNEGIKLVKAQVFNH